MLYMYFFTSSLTLTPTHNTSGGVSSAPPISTPTSTFNTTSILLKLSPQLSGGESTRSQSLTPVPSEKNDEDGDKTVTELDTSDDNKDEGEDTIGEDTILTEDSIELSGGTTDEVTEDFSHDFEDDVSDTSFRELLPSISHQRQHIMKGRKTPPISESEQPLTSTHEVQIHVCYDIHVIIHVHVNIHICTYACMLYTCACKYLCLWLCTMYMY